MVQVHFKGKPTKLSGELPRVGQSAPDFKLVGQDLSDVSLAQYQGKKKILNVFVSIDTPVCAQSVREFHKKISDLSDVVVLNISGDLPFALGRFCAAEGIKNAHGLSTFRSNFGKEYGIAILDGPLHGLCARAVVVLDQNNKVIYEELVSEISHEPDYDKALVLVKGE